jgi:hypothetical protein
MKFEIQGLGAKPKSRAAGFAQSSVLEPQPPMHLDWKTLLMKSAGLKRK